jgi:hypothetical protein
LYTALHIKSKQSSKSGVIAINPVGSSLGRNAQKARTLYILVINHNSRILKNGANGIPVSYGHTRAPLRTSFGSNTTFQQARPGTAENSSRACAKWKIPTIIRIWQREKQVLKRRNIHAG